MKQFITAFMVAALATAPSLANARDGKSIETRKVLKKRAPANTERASHSGASKASSVAGGCKARTQPALPFAISVDGEQLDSGAISGEEGAARCTDIALERARYPGEL